MDDHQLGECAKKKDTHQATSVDTHCFRLFAAGGAIQHTAKVVVEVVTQGEAAEFTGVGA